MQDLYLADITSWGGNSGSPVFIRLSGALEQGGIISGVQYLLLGVMQGYFNSDRPASLDTAAITDTAHLNIELTDNSGIAAIVPADKIIDIVGQPRITAYISIIKANAYAKSGKLSEAESSFKDAIDMLRKNDPEHPLLREALREYAALLQNAGRFPEANFLLRQANQVNNTLHTPNDQLR
jgi:tetratricopeptide (TPR) repeat protein